MSIIREVTVSDATDQPEGELTINGTVYFGTTAHVDTEERVESVLSEVKSEIRAEYTKVFERFPEVKINLGDSEINGNPDDTRQFVDLSLDLEGGIGVFLCPHCGEPYLHYWGKEDSL